jgi:hypothetical protein
MLRGFTDCCQRNTPHPTRHSTAWRALSFCAMYMSPRPGVSRPAMVRMVAVLPHPLGPSSATTSPERTVQEMRSIARTLPQRLLTSDNCTSAMWYVCALAGVSTYGQASAPGAVRVAQHFCLHTRGHGQKCMTLRLCLEHWSRHRSAHFLPPSPARGRGLG